LVRGRQIAKGEFEHRCLPPICCQQQTIGQPRASEFLGPAVTRPMQRVPLRVLRRPLGRSCRSAGGDRPVSEAVVNRTPSERDQSNCGESQIRDHERLWEHPRLARCRAECDPATLYSLRMPPVNPEPTGGDCSDSSCGNGRDIVLRPRSGYAMVAASPSRGRRGRCPSPR
jgi:hypothetical protein